MTYPFRNSLIHGGFPFLRPFHVQNLDKWLNGDALEVGEIAISWRTNYIELEKNSLGKRQWSRWRRWWWSRTAAAAWWFWGQWGGRAQRRRRRAARRKTSRTFRPRSAGAAGICWRATPESSHLATEIDVQDTRKMACWMTVRWRQVAKLLYPVTPLKDLTLRLLRGLRGCFFNKVIQVFGHSQMVSKY